MDASTAEDNLLLEEDSGEEDIATRSDASESAAKKGLCWEVGQSSLMGLGIFVESYFLFAIGLITPIWQIIYGPCYVTTDPVCNDNIAASVGYSEMGGIILGMLGFGTIAGFVGRRVGSISTAVVMMVGGLVAVCSGGQLNTLMVVFLTGIIIFSIGVGGEYPMAAATSAERFEERRLESRSASTHTRGRTVILTFAMQGWGTVINTTVIIITLASTPSRNCTPEGSNPTKVANNTTCNFVDLDLTWRLQYALGVAMLFGIVIYRIFVLKESKVWLKDQEMVHNMATKRVAGRKRRLCKVATMHYWSRLFGTATGWFLLDVALYGNRLFQSKIVEAVVRGSPPLLTTYLYSLLNASVALVGYYVSAALVDLAWMGRVRLQSIGFFFMAVFFLLSYALFYSVSSGALLTVYLLSTFFSQFANCTTFLLPAELFPTELRTASHGISAACGKLGALIVTIVFTLNNTSASGIFLVSGISSAIGLVISLIFIPNGGNVELESLDEKFNAELDGKDYLYDGEAIAYDGLSYIEIAMGVHRRSSSKRDDDSSKQGTTAS